MRIWMFLLFWGCMGSSWVCAQSAKVEVNPDTLMNRVVRQLTLFPQEKIQVQIDRSVYFPGDTLWLKPYLVHATFHTPLLQSRYIYVELINPLDSVVVRIKLRADSGIFQGYMPLPDQMPEGNYTFRAYTRYMMNNQQADLFQRPVCIRSPRWVNMGLKTSALADEKRGSKLLMEFLNKASEPVFPKQATLRLKDGTTADLSAQGSLLAPAFSAKTMTENRNMLLEFSDNRGQIYSKYFGLITDKEDYQVSFYPEGGYLLAGADCRVAFKALGKSGHVSRVSVQVLDSKDQVLTSATVLHEGMGIFSFVPLAGEKYRARCVNPYGMIKTFDLPGVQTATHGLRVDRQADGLVVSLQSASPTAANSLYLLAHVRGVLVYAAWWEPGKKQYVFDPHMFPSGVVQWLLLDKAMNPLSERLVFVDHGDPLNYQWHTDKPVYGKREQVQAQLQIKELRQRMAKGSLSVSVTEAQTADTAYNIRSTLLLTSELRGKIENPAFYLQPDSVARIAADLLMLVHGWRRYQLPEVIKGQLETPKSAPETGFRISGRIKPVFAFETTKKFTVIINGTNNKYLDKTTTDKDRRFAFEGFDFPDGMGFDLRAIREAGYTPNEIRVLVDGESYLPVKNGMAQEQMIEKENDTAGVRRPDDRFLIQSGMRSHQLSEVQIKAKYWGGSDYIRFNAREVSKTPYVNMHGLLEYMGLNVSADEIYYNGRKIIIFVDGAVCSPLAVLYYLSLSDVEDIAFIKDAAREQVNDFLEPMQRIPMARQKTDNLGSMGYPENLGALNVLNITAKAEFDSRFLGRYANIEDRVAVAKRSIFPLGFQQPIAFYAAQYDSPEKKNAPDTDVRATIYWNPDLPTDTTGTATFSFYTADMPGTYTVVIEGVSEKGEIIYTVQKIEVK